MAKKVGANSTGEIPLPVSVEKLAPDELIIGEDGMPLKRPPSAELVRSANKERIELLNFSIEFSHQFRKFHRILMKFYKISGILNNFEHF